jgi:hypothetical protein
MGKIREIWEKKKAAGMGLTELGRAMGLGDGRLAHAGAHQFLQRRDPRISSVRKFARAVGVSVARLVRE